MLALLAKQEWMPVQTDHCKYITGDYQNEKCETSTLHRVPFGKVIRYLPGTYVCVCVYV